MSEGVRSTHIGQASIVDEVLANVTLDGIAQTARIPTAALGAQIAQGAGAIVAKQVKATFAQLDAIKGTMAQGDVGLVMFDPDAAKRGQYAKEGGVLVKKAELTETQAGADAALAKQYRDEALAVAPSFWEDIRDEAIEGAAGEANRSEGEADRSLSEADRSVLARILSEAARDASAVAAGPVYLTESAGIAAVVNGVQFVALSPDGQYLEKRQRVDASQSTLIARYLTAKGMESRVTFESAPGYAITFLDAVRNRLWLEARDTDGGPTDWSRDHMLRRIEEVRKLPELVNAPGILAAITDTNGLLTDITLDWSTGQIADWVMQRWAVRLAPLLSLPDEGALYRWPDVRGSTAVTIKPKDTYVRGHEVLPVLPDTAKIACWASSTGGALAPEFSAMAAGFGASYFDGGQGGERSEHIAARLGAIPALLTVLGGNIPASGSVVVTAPASNYPLSISARPFDGTLAGVFGTLAYDTGVYKFTRATPGSVVAVSADSPFLPSAGAAQRAAVTLLNAGKNDLSQGAPSADVIARIEACFDFLSPFVRRCIVMGQFADGGTPEVGNLRDRIKAVNAANAARYGAQFFDFYGYVTGSQIWADTGITPTSDDLAAQAIGNKPPSVSHDDGHLNAAGNAGVRIRIAAMMQSLGWY